MDSPFTSSLQVVGIGASAGGLEALEKFFRNVPVNSGLTFVVIQHLSPDHKSMMPSLLSRFTDIPVKLATDEIALERNKIYLIPATKNIILKRDSLMHINRATSPKINLSVDIFFISLAEEKGEKAIGVILSGTGSDGTRGGLRIKESGGMIFVQNPENIRFNGMPSNAISAGIADYVLNVEEIPVEIINYLEFTKSRQLVPIENENGLLNEILMILKENLNKDFLQYRSQTLKRRLVKRMSLTGLETMEEYKHKLKLDKEEQKQLANEFLINVTEFFRDQEYITVFQKRVIPELFKNIKNGLIKIWVIGCSTGEEAYSIGILINEYIEEFHPGKQFKVFASDIDRGALDVAMKGMYDQRITMDIPSQYLSKYFKLKDGLYSVNSFFRKKIIFSYHNILTDPPFSKMDLITCRNVLIYFKQEAQQKVFKNIVFSLKANGYLFLGASESLGKHSDHFETIHKRARIFRKVRNLDTPIGASPLFVKEWETFTKSVSKKSVSDLSVESIISLVELTNSICIIFNDQLHIHRLYGDFNRVASFPKEGFDFRNLKLLKLLPGEFNVPISSALSQIKENSKLSVSKTLVFKYEESTHLAKFSIKKLNHIGPKNEQHYLVSITGLDHSLPFSEKKDDNKITQSSDDVKLLEQMLSDTRENLQLTIEELEASNEEAQATNEELVSANEELQSTNEELQSVNEELNTVNAELEERNIQLLELNADFENLINSSGAINLFLNMDMKVKNFTSSIQPIFGLLQSDVGRSITDFAMPYSEFIEDVEKVLFNLQIVRKEVLMKNNKWYMQTIQPYRTSEDIIKGVAINYSDITTIKSTNNFLENILKTIPGIIYIFNLEEGKNEYINPTAIDLGGYSKSEIKNMGGNLISELMDPRDYAVIEDHFDKIKKSKTNEVKTVEYRIKNKPGLGLTEADWFMSYDIPIERNKDGVPIRTIGIALNIENAKKNQLELQQQNKLLLNIASLNPSDIFVFDYQAEKCIYSSISLLSNLGFTSENIDLPINEKMFSLVMKKEEYLSFEAWVQKIKQGEIRQGITEIVVYTKKKEKKWLSVLVAPYDLDENYKVISLGFFVNDITNQKSNQETLEKTNQELEQITFISSHDLKQPLHTIAASAGILTDLLAKNSDPIVQKCLKMINGTSKVMGDSIRMILSYAKLEEEVHFEEFHLIDVINEVTLMLNAEIVETNAEIKVGRMEKVFADKALVKMAIQNLISNGLKFQPDGSKPIIEVSCFIQKEMVVLSIKDNGIGIPKDQQDRIFTLFQRLNNRDKYEGTGIGLAHVKKILQIHNGKVTLESEKGKGSAFFLHFPQEINETKK